MTGGEVMLSKKLIDKIIATDSLYITDGNKVVFQQQYAACPNKLYVHISSSLFYRDAYTVHYRIWDKREGYHDWFDINTRQEVNQLWNVLLSETFEGV